MNRANRWLSGLALAAVAMFAAPPARSASAPIVSGQSIARFKVRPGSVGAYWNNGFAQEVDGDSVTVRVTLSEVPWTRATFVSPPTTRYQTGSRESDVEAFARTAVAGAATRAEAVARLLQAIAKRVRYVAEPRGEQEAADVLSTGAGDCVGLANLATAGLAALDVPARIVRGGLVRSGGVEPHRWIEVFYPDAGWVFSDPSESINYVTSRHIVMTPPAEPDPTYLPVRAIEAAPRLAASDGGLLVLDVRPGRPSTLAERRLLVAQFGATVFGRVRPATAGTMTLLGRGLRRVQSVAAGEPFSFPGLDPGPYLLQGEFGGGRTEQRLQVDGAHLVSVAVDVR